MDVTIKEKTETKTSQGESIKQKKENGFLKFLYSGGILIFIVLAFVLYIVIYVALK
jgi:hypothetical protein